MSTIKNTDSFWYTVPPGFTNKTTMVTNSGPCLEVNFSAFQLHKDGQDVVSARVTSLVNNVIHVVFFPALFLIGFPSNVLNLVVFFQHGLKQRINLCLCSLSFVDLIFVTLGFLVYVEKILLKDFTSSYRSFGLMTKLFINNRLFGLYTGSVFSSQFVSAVIAGERCLCVTWPLKSNVLLKTKTVGIVLLVGILLIFGGRLVTDMKYYMVCVEDVETSLTSFLTISSQFYDKNKRLINMLDGIVYGLGLPVVLCMFVIITTIITAVTLQKSTAFQKTSSSSSSATFSPRNIAVTRMLIYLSVQFIVLNTPNLLFRVSLLFLPELNTTGDWANLYFLFIGLTGLCGMLSSSLNFLVYFFFGSKYRETVRGMLCKCRMMTSKEKRSTAGV